MNPSLPLSAGKPERGQVQFVDLFYQLLQTDSWGLEEGLDHSSNPSDRNTKGIHHMKLNGINFQRRKGLESNSHRSGFHPVSWGTAALRSLPLTLALLLLQNGFALATGTSSHVTSGGQTYSKVAQQDGCKPIFSKNSKQELDGLNGSAQSSARCCGGTAVRSYGDSQGGSCLYFMTEKGYDAPAKGSYVVRYNKEKAPQQAAADNTPGSTKTDKGATTSTSGATKTDAPATTSASGATKTDIPAATPASDVANTKAEPAPDKCDGESCCSPRVASQVTGTAMSSAPQSEGYTGRFVCCITGSNGGKPGGSITLVKEHAIKNAAGRKDSNGKPLQPLDYSFYGTCTWNPETMTQGQVYAERDPAKFQGSSSFSKNQNYKRSDFVDADGPCAYGETIVQGSGEEGRFSCKKTEGKIQEADTIRGVTTTLGTALAQNAGQAAQQKAQSEGTQSSALAGASSTAKAAATAQTVVGVASLYNALQLKKEMDRLNKNAAEFKSHTRSGTLVQQTVGKEGDASFETDGTHGSDATKQLTGDQGHFTSNKKWGQQVVEKWKLNGDAPNGFGKLTAVRNCGPEIPPTVPPTPEYLDYQRCTSIREQEVQARKSEADSRQAAAGKEMQAIGNIAASEQKEMANKAKSKFMENAAGAIVAFVQAKLANDTAKSLKDAEITLRPNPNPSTAGFTFQGADPFADSNGIAPGNSQVIDGGSVQASGAEAGPDPRSSAPPPGGFGDVPFAKERGSEKTGNPDPGAFNAGNSGGGASGGGGGGSGGGSTSPSAGGGDGDKDPQSSYAGLGKSSGAYESGGGARPAGGSGAAGGPDLSGLLAQFLPKDKDAGPDNGILEFGSRAPAAGNTDSLLDSSVNIFERVHEAYQTKSRKGFGR